MARSPICIDASLAVRMVYDDPASEAVESHWRTWKQDGRRILASAILPLEVANALHRYWKHDLLTEEAADHSLRAFLALEVALIAESATFVRAARLAREFDLPAIYDAHYLAVAEAHGAELWTADYRLARKVESLPWVRSFPKS